MILEKFSGAVRIINDFIDDFSAVRKNRLNALDISHLTEEYDNILQSKKLIDSLHEEVKEAEINCAIISIETETGHLPASRPHPGCKTS